MINQNLIITDFKNGMSTNEIAKKYHLAISTISSVIHKFGLPTNRVIRKILNDDEFKKFFIETYNSIDDMKLLLKKLHEHPFFNKITMKSMHQRMSEIRNYFGLTPKMPERTYQSEYDRIRGYIIRNSKFCAKRRGLEFNIEYTDFELPEYCPLLGIKLEYGLGIDGNSPAHASLDRIDNSKGYIKGNVMIISKMANAMKNNALLCQLETFNNNCKYLTDYFKEHGALGDITDVFPHWKKLSLDPQSLNLQ